MSIVIALIIVFLIAGLIINFYPKPAKPVEEKASWNFDPTPTPSWVNEIKFEKEVVVTPQPTEKIVKKSTKKKPTPKMSAKPKIKSKTKK